MSPKQVDPATLALYLRQRQDLGQDPLYLETLSRAEALASVKKAGGPNATSSRPESAAKVRSGAAAGVLPPDGAGARHAAARREAIDSDGADARATPASPRVELPILDSDLDAARAQALVCTRCRLHSGRKQAVFSDGNPNARLMVVGEAPGANEDQTGLPFVGAAGKLLDLMLASIGLSRKDTVYICNVIKCRPPDNRDPLPDEVAACAPFLRRQIELIRPEALLAVGKFSGQLLARSDRPLGKLRGEVYSYEGVPLIVTYHPAALLRNASWSRGAWDDLQLLRQVMDG